jgi:predicted Zn-dependent peptidase
LFSLIIAGDIQSSSSLDAAVKLFEPWKGSGGEESISFPEITSAVDSSSQIQMLPEKALCGVGFGVPGITAKHTDFLAMSFANQVFGKGRSSRLAQKIEMRKSHRCSRVRLPGAGGQGPLAIQ